MNSVQTSVSMRTGHISPYGFCQHDVRLHNFMLDSEIKRPVMIDTANSCIKAPGETVLGLHEAGGRPQV